jgi:hypothetical protein
MANTKTAGVTAQQTDRTLQTKAVQHSVDNNYMYGADIYATHTAVPALQHIYWLPCTLRSA